VKVLVFGRSVLDGLPPHLNPLPQRGEEMKYIPLALLEGGFIFQR
jgi:hypothetical protein